jgi:hypothetical protein
LLARILAHSPASLCSPLVDILAKHIILQCIG